MTKRNQPHRFAGTAIAAFLALSTTLAWAQEAPGPLDATVAAPVAQPAQTIVLPPVATVQPVTPPLAEVAPVVESAPVARAAPVRTVRPATVAPAPAAVAVTAPAVEAAPVAAPVALDTFSADEPPAQPAATAAPVSDDDSSSLLLFGLAGALGLGAMGLYAARRRRRVDRVDPASDYESAAAPVEPVVATPPRTTLVGPAFTPMARWSEPRVPAAQPADNRALNLNRAALLNRMVAAEPDSNNPFKSDKARRRRARLMLQSLASNRWEVAELAPGFDWREMAQAVEERETVKS